MAIRVLVQLSLDRQCTLHGQRQLSLPGWVGVLRTAEDGVGLRLGGAGRRGSALGRVSLPTILRILALVVSLLPFLSDCIEPRMKKFLLFMRITSSNKSPIG